MSLLLTDPVINGSRAPTAKPAVRVATTAAGTLATSFVVGAIIDGVTLVVEDRILVKNQAAAVDNGIYSVQSSGAPLRTDDMPVGDNVTGTNVFVQAGTANIGTGWVVTSTPAVVGTNALTYVRYDVTTTLTTVRGGTGTASLGGTNTLLYTPTTGSAITALPTANNSVLITGAGGVPALSTTLPAGLAIPTPTVTGLRIADSDGSHYYQVEAGNLTSNVNLALPPMTADQTFLFAGLAQTVTNKTIQDTSNAFANAVDPTKTGTFDLSAVPTGTNVALQWPTQSGTIATTQYVDGVAQGLDWKNSCVAKTTSTLSVTPAGSGPTKTLTNNSNGPISASVLFDTVVLVLGDRVLVDNSAFGGSPNLSCGIYTVTSAGSAGTPWVLTRAVDANTSAKVTTGMATFIEQGAQFASTQWVLITPPPIILDTTPLSFTQFGGLNGVTAGAGLTKTGNTLDVGGSPTIATAADFIYVNSSATANQVLLSSGTVGTAATYGAVPLGSTAAVSGTLPIVRGGTGNTSFTTNGVIFASSTTVLSSTAAANSSVLVTSAGGVPSLSTTLPSALTLGANFRLNDNDSSQQYIIAGGALTAGAAANSTLTLPGDSGTAINDVFTLNNLAQILQNKTLVNPIIQTALRDTNGNNALTIAPTASAVNSWQLQNAATAGSPTLATIGTDTNISMTFQQKGTGTYNFSASSTAAAAVRLFEQTSNGSAYVGLTVGNVPSSYTLQLPLADGTLNQVLRTNGAGVLSFANAPSSSFSTWTLATSQTSVSSTSSGGGVVLYFTWLYSIMNSYTTGTLWFELQNMSTSTFNVDYINVSNSTQLGALTGISSNGIYSITLTNNIVSTGGQGTQTAVRAWRTASGGSTPIIRGIAMQWS